MSTVFHQEVDYLKYVYANFPEVAEQVGTNEIVRFCPKCGVDVAFQIIQKNSVRMEIRYKEGETPMVSLPLVLQIKCPRCGRFAGWVIVYGTCQQV